MIDPSNSSVDYGAMLKAPAGYDVDFAIATTYSLDMRALMGAYLSLGLSVDTDSSLAQDSMYLFAALSEMRGKVLVFCEKGRIGGRGEYSSLYCQLESGIAEVDLPEIACEAGRFKYPSFHPKTWILRFTPTSGVGSVRYRMCVLSRNLTFDSSWDLASSFDGVYREQHTFASEGGYSVAAYLRKLRGLYGSGPYLEKLDQVIAEIPYVRFNSNEKGYSLSLPFSFSGVSGAKQFNEEFSHALARSSRAMVMTPFISGASSAKDPLARIADRFVNADEKPMLVTRRSAVAECSRASCLFDTFSVFAIRDDLITAEFEHEQETLEEAASGDQMVPDLETRDIHAKAYLFDCADDEGRCELFVGSANASIKGFFANCEAMVHLTIRRGNAYASVLAELGLTEAEMEKGSLFEPLAYEAVLQLASHDDAEKQRLKLQQGFDHFLRKADFAMRIRRDDRGGFEVTVIAEADDAMMEHCEVVLATGGSALAMAKRMTFTAVAQGSLTAFVRIRYEEGEFKAQRLMKCRLLGGASYLEQQRKSLFKQVTKNRFSEYLEFRLSGNPEFVASLFGERGHFGSSVNRSSASSYAGLYENLLRAYTLKPRQTEALVSECLELLAADQEEESDAELEELTDLLKTIQGGAHYARS